MNLERQIDEARQALADLTKDEAELSRLEAEQVQEIDGLKDSGSKDFAALATLEGKRAALASMLAEQRQAIGRARDEVARLEAAKAKGEALEELRGRCEKLDARREEVESLFNELHDFVQNQVNKIGFARQLWSNELTETRHLVARFYGLPHMSNASYSQGDPVRESWLVAFNEIGGVAQSALSLDPVGRLNNGLTYSYAGLETGLQAAETFAASLPGRPKAPVVTRYIKGTE